MTNSNSTPDRPIQLELTFELPGTPEQVWDAIATAKGLSSWFIPTEMEERQGGAMRMHMGPDQSSPARITAYERPRRFVYEEPEWAELFGHPGADVTPMASEFLIEATSGGTCVLRVVTSAFGTGADWENEVFTAMQTGWVPFFEHLRLYLQHFAGQHATMLSASGAVSEAAEKVRARLRTELGLGEVGDTFSARGVTGRIEHVSELETLVILEAPLPGLFGVGTMPTSDATTYVQLGAYLFSDDAPAYVEREQPGWQEWLDAFAEPR